MFSRKNVFVSVMSVLVIGITIMLLTEQQRPVIAEDNNPPVVAVVPQSKPVKHPVLPKNSPFHQIVPPVAKMTNSKFRELAQLGRILTKVLIAYGITDGPLPPDKTQTLPKAITREDWEEVYNLSFDTLNQVCYNTHAASENLTEVEHQFFIEVVTTIGKHSPVSYIRFLAAMSLADSAIAFLNSYDDLPEKFPASIEDARQCFNSAFTFLLDQAESTSVHELEISCGSLSFTHELLYAFLMVEALSSTETTEKGLRRVLNARINKIANKINLITSRTKSPERQKSLNRLSKSLNKFSSHLVGLAAMTTAIKKQVRPFAETLIAAVNNEDSAAMLKHYLNPKPQFITQLKNSKSLRDDFSHTKNTTSLKLLEIGAASISIENEGLFKNTMMVKDQVYSVPLFLTVTDSHGMKKTVRVEQDWMIRNGRWEIVDRDK